MDAEAHNKCATLCGRSSKPHASQSALGGEGALAFATRPKRSGEGAAGDAKGNEGDGGADSAEESTSIKAKAAFTLSTIPCARYSTVWASYLNQILAFARWSDRITMPK